MSANQIEIHYFLPPGVHSADAYKLVQAETEFLAIIKEISNTFDVEFKLETLALSEGGIKQIWKAVGENAPQIGLILSIVAIIISLRPRGDEELIHLQKQESTLHIQYLKKQLAEKATPTPEEITKATEELSSTLPIVRRRSNFYQAIYAEEKISSISYTVLKENVQTHEPTVVVRNDFPQYIALTGELPTELDEDAVIGIISPVLHGGRFKWKGEYKGTVIDFWVQDKLFTESVLQKKTEFHSGTAIRCVLK